MPQEYQDPIASVIQGLLQGHQIAGQIHRQKQEDEAFARHNAAQDRDQGIQEVLHRLQMRDLGALPVNNGMVEQQMPDVQMPGLDVGGVNLPGSSVSGKLVRKARSADTVKLPGRAGDTSYELPTPEEQQQRQIRQSNVLQEAKAANDAKLAEEEERRRLVFEHGGTAAPAGLIGIPQGTMLSSTRLIAATKAAQEMNKPTPIAPGGKLVRVGLDGKAVDVASNPKEATGDFGTYALPAYAHDKGKKVEDLTLDEMAEARAEFTGENRNPTEASLAWKAVHGKNELERSQANAALLRLDKSKLAARPVTNILNSDSGRAAIEAAAQSLASGDLTRLRDIAGTRAGERLIIYNRAKELNPKFNPAEIDRKIKMEDYYANGHGAQNLQSFGTFLEHAGSASEAINSMRQINAKLLNKPINWWRQNMGADPQFQSFVAALEPVRKEFEGFLLGGRALYGDDRKQAEIILNENSPLSVLQAALGRMGHTAEARYNEENYRYKKLMGKDLQEPFSPEAQAGAKLIGVNLPGGGSAAAGGGSVKMKAPDGSVTEVAADQVEHYKSLGATVVK